MADLRWIFYLFLLAIGEYGGVQLSSFMVFFSSLAEIWMLDGRVSIRGVFFLGFGKGSYREADFLYFSFHRKFRIFLLFFD